MPSFDEIIEASATQVYRRSRPHPDYPVEKIYDFDERKDDIERKAFLFALEICRRMTDEHWLELAVVGYSGVDMFQLALEAFEAEKAWYPTNKPKTQELLFKRTFVNNIIDDWRFKRLVDNDNILSKEASAYWGKVHGIVTTSSKDDDDEPLHFHPLDFTTLEQEAKKEASLFPDADPVQVEAPGNIILSLTTDEAAVVVYFDEEHKGKEVTLESKQLSRINSKKPVMEIKRGKESYFVAIFNHIPLVTAEDKNMGTWRKNFLCRVKFFNLEEEHFLFKGQVTVQDWRGWEVTSPKK